MTSRDYDYLTLRNLQCYDATDGSYVPTGYVLTAGVRGQGIWTSTPTGPTGPTGSVAPLYEGTLTGITGAGSPVDTLVSVGTLTSNAMVIIMPINFDSLNIISITAYLAAPDFRIVVTPYTGTLPWGPIGVRWWVLRT